MKESMVKNLNVFLLGLCFCLVFIGFNSMGGIQALIYKSAIDPASDGYKEGFNGDGLWSLSIIYLVFTVSNCLAPSVVALTGPRLAMGLSASIYALFIGQMLILNTALMYTASAFVGFAGSVLWTAQGNFLALNSDSGSITRNSGIFWAMLNASGVIGNCFVYFQFEGKDSIDTATRNFVGIVLFSVTVAGTGLMLLLRPTPWANGKDSESAQTPLQALILSAKLFVTKDMLLLCLSFFYTGINLNLWSAVYGTCIGFTNQFGNERKALATINGILVGCGSVLGGMLFGILGNKTVRKGRSPVVILGFILSMVTYGLIALNIPNTAPYGETKPTDTAFIEPNKYLAISASFILGFSDACINTQVTAVLGSDFKEQSVSAFAVYKLMQSLAACISFFYSPLISLYWILLIASTSNVASVVAFCLAERSLNNKKKNSLETNVENL